MKTFKINWSNVVYAIIGLSFLLFAYYEIATGAVFMAVVATAIPKKLKFSITEGVTKSGKSCLLVDTNGLRIEKEQYKELMQNVTLLGGFGFQKYSEEHGKRLLAFMNVSKDDLNGLLTGYNWAPKVKKANSTKRATKQSKSAKKTAMTDITTEITKEELQAFRKFQALLKSSE